MHGKQRKQLLFGGGAQMMLSRFCGQELVLDWEATSFMLSHLENREESNGLNRMDEDHSSQRVTARLLDD